MSQTIEEALKAPHQVAYTYKRSLGPILSQFFTAIRDRKILGVKRPDGTVMVPAKEYDPDTAASLDELVEVGQSGVVKSWAWVQTPRRQQPLDRPFAYALVQLDGSDTPFLHAVDAGSESAMSTGMRVKARWNDEATGMITDFVFEPEAGGEA